MSVEVWQKELDGRFPFGGVVTIVEDVAERTMDSAVVMTPRFIVMGVDSKDQPLTRFNILEFEKDYSFVIESLSEFSDGVTLVVTPGSAKDLLISVNIGGPARAALEQARKEWYS